ncbi:MAG TPA: hydrogenase 4 subunit F [Verrucomicrobiae bacterium]|nr:hydrogenase 4 subunit F [Verrucomicrobiae bacterium]
MILAALVLMPLVTGVSCLASRSRLTWERANLLAFALVLVLTSVITVEILRDGPVTALGGFLHADALSALVMELTAFVAFVCSIYAIGYFRRDLEEGRINETQLRHYYLLTPIFVGAMLLAPMADNLGVMWVAIESTTLASALLVTFYNQKTSFEAGWKYVIIGSVGISLALFGTVLTYSSAIGVLGEHTRDGMNWSTLLTIADRLDPSAMRLAFILVLLGYGTKAGLAPMHTWKPDAYAEAPVPAATLLGAAFINCAVYAIMRFDVLAEKCLGHEFPSKMLVGFGIFSILLAAPFVLVQRNFRRLLAYSSIDHAGIMVAALGFGGKLGALGAVLHMLFHAVTKPLLFFSVGNVQQEFGTPYFRKVTGVIGRLPWTGVLLLAAALAVIGTPPFSIFQSEFTALSAALAADRSLAAALFVLGVVTIFAGFLTHMAKMNLGAQTAGAPRGTECRWKLTAMLLVGLAVVGLGVWLPAPVYELVQKSARIVGGAL